MDNPMFGLVVVGLCIFAFLAFLLVYGQMVGGSWNIIAQGVAKFIIVIVVFVYACFILVYLARRGS